MKHWIFKVVDGVTYYWTGKKWTADKEKAKQYVHYGNASNALIKATNKEGALIMDEDGKTARGMYG